MENTISNRANMIRSTQTWCTNNPTPTMGIPAFAPVKGNVDSKLILIDGLTAIADASTSGVTLDTILLRNVMTTFALKCGDAVSAYAASVNNNTLRAKVTFTISQMNRFKKEEVDDICETIHFEANANMMAAGAFGYTLVDVTDLFSAISLYRTSIQNPRQAIITRATAKENIKAMMRDIIDNLYKKQMDKMVNTLKISQPDFHSNYFKARIILDLGSTSAKLRGSLKNTEDIPLVGASVYLALTGTTTKVAETVTTTGGKYNLTPLVMGDYDFYWEELGYLTQTEINVHISPGEEVNRNIILQHLVISGTINSGQIINIFGPANPAWRVGATIKIKNTTTTPMIGGIHFYPANNPGDAFSGSGSNLFPGQEETHTITAIDFKLYLNIQNQGPNSGTYEITFL